MSKLTKLTNPDLGLLQAQCGRTYTLRFSGSDYIFFFTELYWVYMQSKALLGSRSIQHTKKKTS